MIPKIIHYCWFGGKPKPACVNKCIESWKKYLPGYKIIEWNETNFNIEKTNQYVCEAYLNKKWAFVSDYVRLKVLLEYGGIYFDTDVEVFRSFDQFLTCPCFMGFESNDYICTAVIGCEPGNSIINSFERSYNSRKFVKPDGTLDMETTNVVAVTKILIQNGLKRNGKEQQLEGVKIYPQYYFSSNDFLNIFHRYNRRIYSYHHCQATWYESKRNGKFWDLFRHYLIGVLRNTVGTDRIKKIKK